MPRKSCCRTLLFVLCSLVSLSTARAQSRTFQEDNLKNALPRINWDSRHHGPLIAITPERVKWTTEDNPDSDVILHPLLPRDDRYGLDASVVAEHFKRLLLRFDTLTIFAPPKMVLLNTHLKPANPFLGANTSEQLTRLEATLTPAQWELLGSPGGLGFGDLRENQADLFESILPPTMTIQQETVTQSTDNGVQTEPTNGEKQTLTAAQRLGVRLHLELEANFDLVGMQGDSTGFPHPFHSDVVGGHKLALVSTTGRSLDGELFGQKVSEQVPNRLKPSDLDLKQTLLTDTYVPLTGAKTVGDLLKATQAATGIELHADGRLAGLGVYLSTEGRTVHASDLLEALCWALTATYRKVGPVPGGNTKDFAYVLTYDRVGLSALRDAIAFWARRGNAEYNISNNRSEAAIKKAQPAQYLHYNSDDLLAATPAAQQALHDTRREQLKRGFPGLSATIPATNLTAEQRRQMNEGFKQIDDERQQNPKVPQPRYDSVRMMEGVTLAYIIPGAGEIRDDTADYQSVGIYSGGDKLDQEAKKVSEGMLQTEVDRIIAAAKREPLPLADLVLSVAPESLEDARPLFPAALELGIHKVWIAIRDTDAGRKILTDCIAEGGRRGIKVGARVSVLHTEDEESPLNPAMKDENVFGETASEWNAHRKRILDGLEPDSYYGTPVPDDSRDYLTPEYKGSDTYIVSRLAKIAKTPGLFALALYEAAAPTRDWTIGQTSHRVSWTRSAFGYTVANRLAFLRQQGFDPIDLPLFEIGDENVHELTKLPRFDSNLEDLSADIHSEFRDTPSVFEPLAAWHDFLGKSQANFLSRLRTALAAKQPDLPIYLTGPEDEWVPTLYRRWNVDGPIPFAAPYSFNAPVDKESEPETYHFFPLGATSGTFFTSNGAMPGLGVASDASRPFVNDAYYIRTFLTPQEKPKAIPLPPRILLDFTGLKTGDAVALLKGVMPYLNVTYPTTSETPAKKAH